VICMIICVFLQLFKTGGELFISVNCLGSCYVLANTPAGMGQI